MNVATFEPTAFAAMTAPTSGATRATKETSRARRRYRARLHPTTRWQIALAYAQGVKVVAIAAEYRVSPRFVPMTACKFGLPLRGHRPHPINPADIEHLRRWARRQAKALRREACGWEVLAELE